MSHSHWLRPEDMFEERPAYAVDPSNPGTDVVAAAAAALAATSAAFLPINREYAGLCMQVGAAGEVHCCRAARLLHSTMPRTAVTAGCCCLSRQAARAQRLLHNAMSY